MSYRPVSDMWYLARAKLKGGKKYYGAYLGGFPERARIVLGASIGDPVLHVCGGMARHYPYRGGFGPNDATLDLDPITEPDYLQDARDPFPLDLRPQTDWSLWQAILIDPPYSETDAEQYAPGRDKYPKPNTLVKNALDVLPVGGRVGIIHYVIPGWDRKRSRFIFCAGVICGHNNRGRFFTVFEKTEEAQA